MTKINENSSVVLNYTGKLEDGTVFDSSLNEGREPLSATLGQGSLIPGFESGLIGMGVGETKTIMIEPENAYGNVNPQAFVEVEKSRVPENVEVGMMLQTFGPAGPTTVVVTEIKDEVVVIDANHPLAGKKLIFDLEVLEVA
jgi:FKBP-type peptidyl-prolyl cis-trans isomerase 2